MSTIVYFNSEKLAVTSKKRVFNKSQADELNSVIESAKELTELIDSEQARIEANLKNAYDEGYKSGQEKGYHDALEHVAKKLVLLSKEAADVRKKSLDQSTAIAMTVVQKIASNIGTGSFVYALAKDAAMEIADKESVTLYVNAANFSKVKSHFLGQPIERPVPKPVATPETTTPTIVEKTGSSGEANNTNNTNSSNNSNNSRASEAVAPEAEGDSSVTDMQEFRSEQTELREQILTDEFIPLSPTCTLQIKTDNNLSLTDCVLETPVGKVNAGLDTQLERIKQHLQITS